MSISITCEDFSGQYSHVNCQGKSIFITLNDLALAMVTVGRSGWTDALSGGIQRAYEITALMSSIFAYIDNSKSTLTMSDLYKNLESSEKGIASYRIGMALSKLVAERTLGIQWLRHVQPLIKRNIIQRYYFTDAQPDLIGQDAAGNWHVIEAKGRTSKQMDLAALQKALYQTAQIEFINGESPVTRCASVATLGKTPFEVRFQDTPQEGDGEFNLLLSKYLEEYYSPIQLFTRFDRGIYHDYVIPGLLHSPTFTLRRLPGMSTYLGIHSELFKFIQSKNPWGELPRELNKINDEYNIRHTLIREQVPMNNDSFPTNIPSNVSISLDGYITLQGD